MPPLPPRMSFFNDASPSNSPFGTMTLVFKEGISSNYFECAIFDSLGLLSTIRVVVRENLVLGLKPTMAYSFVTSLFFRCTVVDAMSLPPRRTSSCPSQARMSM